MEMKYVIFFSAPDLDIFDFKKFDTRGDLIKFMNGEGKGYDFDAIIYGQLLEPIKEEVVTKWSLKE